MSWLVFCVNICVCVSEKCPDSIVGTCSFKRHALLSVCPLAVRPLNPPLFAHLSVTASRFHRVVVDKTTGRSATNCRRWSVVTTRRKHDATRRRRYRKRDRDRNGRISDAATLLQRLRDALMIVMRQQLQQQRDREERQITCPTCFHCRINENAVLNHTTSVKVQYWRLVDGLLYKCGEFSEGRLGGWELRSRRHFTV